MGQNGVLKRLPRGNLRKRHLFTDQLHNAPARQMRKRRTATINGGQGGVFRQAQAQGLDQAGHGRGRAHGHTDPVTARHAAFRRHKIGQGHFACAHGFGKLPDIGSRANILASELAIQHGSRRDHHGGQINTGSPHQLAGRSLVTAAQQHDPIDRIAADRFLNLHGQEIAKQHGRRAHLGLAQ